MGLRCHDSQDATPRHRRLSPLQLSATRLDAALARTATPRPPAAASPARLTIDTTRVFTALGIRGNASGSVAQPSVVLVPGKVTMHGETLVPAMAYGTPINVQMIDSS